MEAGCSVPLHWVKMSPKHRKMRMTSQNQYSGTVLLCEQISVTGPLPEKQNKLTLIAPSAGQWPGSKPFRRAARWDGVIPMARDQLEGDKISPSDLTELLAVIDAENKRSPDYDVVMIGTNPTESELEAYSNAGVTWWLEASDPWSVSFEEMRDQVCHGPHPK